MTLLERGSNLKPDFKGEGMEKDIVYSNQAPDPIGPYSQAIKVSNMIFTSGQIALDAETNALISGGIEEQTEKVLENLKAVLNAAGSDLEKVVKTTIYLKNMGDFSTVNQIYATYFKTSVPARSTVEVSRLPKDVLIEIDCIAIA